MNKINNFYKKYKKTKTHQITTSKNHPVKGKFKGVNKVVNRSDNLEVLNPFSNERLKVGWKWWLYDSIKDIDLNSNKERDIGYSNSFNEELYCFTLLLKRFKFNKFDEDYSKENNTMIKNNNMVSRFGLEYGSRNKYSECLSIFKRDLSEKIFGKNCRRKGKGFNIFIPFYEEVNKTNNHYHVLISKPKGVSYRVLEKLIYELWCGEKYRWSRYNDGNGCLNNMMLTKRDKENVLLESPSEVVSKDRKGLEEGKDRIGYVMENREERDKGRFTYFDMRKSKIDLRYKDLIEDYIKENGNEEYEKECKEFDYMIQSDDEDMNKEWRRRKDLLDQKYGDFDSDLYELGLKKINEEWKEEIKYVRNCIFESDSYREFIGLDFQRFYMKSKDYSFIDYGLKKFKKDKIDVRNLHVGEGKM